MSELMGAVDKDFTMTSLDFLNKIINPARVAAGEKPVPNHKFIKKVEDELDDLPEALFWRHDKINNLQAPEQKYYDLNFDQMMLVGMRESKVVRKKVLEKLKELQQKNTPARQLPPPATLRDKMDCANLVLNALPNLSERSKQALLAPLAQEAGLYLEFPVVEQQFMSTSDLANLVGCSPQKLGRWANARSLKVPQYGEIRLSKARHCDKQIEQWYWNEKGIKVVCEMFAEG